MKLPRYRAQRISGPARALIGAAAITCGTALGAPKVPSQSPPPLGAGSKSSAQQVPTRAGTPVQAVVPQPKQGSAPTGKPAPNPKPPAPQAKQANGVPDPDTVNRLLTAFKEAKDQAERSLSRAKGVATEAETASTSLKKLAVGKPADDAALGRLADMANVLEGLTKAGVRKELRTLLDPKLPTPLPTPGPNDVLPLAIVHARLYTATKALPSGQTTLTDEGEKLLKSLDEEAKRGATILEGLDKAFSPVYGATTEFLKEISASLSPLEVSPETEASGLRKLLPGMLARVPEAVRLRRLFEPRWKRLAAALQAEVGEVTHKASTEPILATRSEVDLKVAQISGALPKWLKTLQAHADHEHLEISRVLQLYAANPFGHRADALLAANRSTALQSDLDKVRTAAADLLIQLRSSDVSGKTFFQLPMGTGQPDPKPIDTGLPAFEKLALRLGSVATLLQQENIPVNRGGWVSDQISLYYFDDIPRLMRVLSDRSVEKGGNGDFAGQADTKRKELFDAQQNLENARAETRDLKRELEIKREEMRVARLEARDGAQAAQRDYDQAHRKAQRAAEEASVVSAQKSRAQTDFEQSEAALTKAKSDLEQADAALKSAREAEEVAKKALDAKPEDPELQRKYREAVAATQAAQRARDRAAAVVPPAQRRRDGAEKRLDDIAVEEARLNSRKTAAEADETAAEEALTKAQTRESDLDDETKGLALKLKTAEDDEKTAVGTMRTKLSELYSAVQFENVAFARARDNVPFLHSPAQATAGDPIDRVALYGFSDSKTIFIRGTREDVVAVKYLISSFDRPQAQAQLTLRTLEISSDGTTAGATRVTEALKIVNTELRVSRAQMDATTTLLRKCLADAVQRAVTDYRARVPLAADAPKVVDDVAPLPKDARFTDEDLAPLAFFHPEVLMRLGWDNSYLQPGPDGTPPDSTAIPFFLRAALPQPGQTTTLAEALIILTLARERYRQSALVQFHNQLPTELARAVADAVTEGTETDGKVSYTAPANPALSTLYRFFAFVPPAGKPIAVGKEPALSSAQRELVWALQRRVVTGPYGDFLVSQLARENLLLSLPSGDTRPDTENIKKQLLPIRTSIHRSFGITEAPGVTPEFERLVAQLRGSANNAREAAANETLKQMIRGVDEDLSRLFVEPMLDRLRKRLLKTHVSVGVIQETSVVGANRLLARVDPKASASLALGQDDDVLGASIQLAQIIAAGQTGGLTTALGGLQKMKREPPAGIYGLTTGNQFRVTPIADPTGQALRFRFDFVGSTQVRDPRGITDPLLSGIDYHSVNTEVQLSNMEIRQISRFQANSKLGIPTRRFGGFPVIRDLPVLKEIPLIGWFAKRTGKAASVQHSLILGQTTLFPTIRDVLDLLTNPDIGAYPLAPLTDLEGPKEAN